MVDPDQSTSGLSRAASCRWHSISTDEPSLDSQGHQSPRLTCRIKAIPIPINAGAEGEAGIAPADENYAAARWLRSAAGNRAVFAIEGILWLKIANLGW